MKTHLTKRILALLLTLAMILSLLPMTIAAEEPAPATVTVYVVDELDGEELYAWAWGPAGNLDAAWPGHALTAAGTDKGDHPYYSIELTLADYDKIIFNRNGQPQTGDLDVTTDADGNAFVVYYLYGVDGNTLQCSKGTDLWPADSLVTVAPTCTEPGESYWVGLLTEEKKIKESTPALGHLDENGDGVCDRCGKYLDGGVVVLYTNDVHCGVDQSSSSIGVAGLAKVKKELEAAYDNVVLVDNGDFIQGELIGTISRGEYLVQLMNFLGYDFGTFGNHEYDYTMPRLKELVDMADMTYLSCNFQYIGPGEDPNAVDVDGYKVVDYNGLKVGYVGITTPESLVKSTPTYFQDENGEWIYTFCNGGNGQELYDAVQTAVDAARADGAQVVVALAHLGIDEQSSPWMSTEVIANTSGINVVLDGHSHSTIARQEVLNKNGETVLLSSTGTKLANIGKLTIAADGTVDTTLITRADVDGVDEETQAYLDQIEAEFEELQQQVVAHTEYDLLTKDPATGARMVRMRETNLGDVCADAYRTILDADIAFVNGGGVRADIPAGDVTYEQIIKVHPYSNMACKIRTTGQQILDALEMASRSVNLDDEGNLSGENGGFLQVSGLKYTINTAIPSTVVLDDAAMFVRVDGERRVQDVKVLQNGEYLPIDPEANYTLASHNYMLKQGGDGINMFRNDELLLDEVKVDNQVLIEYMTSDAFAAHDYSNWQGEGRISFADESTGDLSGKTVILHTNDTHGALLGFAQVAKVKADLEAQGATVILVDAGDYSQGAAYVSLSKGASAITVMNAAGYDYATLGNHEFDYGWAQLKQNLESAEFKVIVADVIDEATGKSIYDGHVIKEVDGVKIGFFGMETPEASTKANPALIVGLSFPQAEAMYAIAQAEIDALKEEGADLVICLAHLGVDAESEPNRSIDLFANVEGIDFIIDGHSHTVMTEGPDGEPIQSTGTKASPPSNDLPSDVALMNVGYIQIDNETKAIEKNELIPLGYDAPVDEEVAAVAQEIMDAVDAEYNVKFAESLVELNGDKAPGNRNMETNLGDLITESMLWAVQSTGGLTVDADHVVAITNGGGIRAWIHAGDVTKKDVNTVLPFGNTVAVVYVTGAELLEALEASTYCTPTAVGGFPQVAGMKFNIDVNKPFDEGDLYPGSTYHKPNSIKRVSIDDINGQPFNPEATYAVVTNNFCAAGGDTYYAFSAASSQFDTGLPLDEVLMDFITEELNGVIGEDYAEPKGRITQEERKPDYVLCGWINGAACSDEGNWNDPSPYVFDKDGKLTVTFTEDSYIWIKYADNSTGWKTNGYIENETSAVFYNYNVYSSEQIDFNKMKVPGGVELCFTLTENNDDTLTLSYERALVNTEFEFLVTSDLHGQIFATDYTQPYANSGTYSRGLTRVSTYIKEQKALFGDNLYVVDMGDTFQGAPLTYYYAFNKPEVKDPAIRAFRSIGYDMWVVGNHEFNYGLPILTRQMDYAVSAGDENEKQLTISLANYLKAETNNDETKDWATWRDVAPYVIKDFGGYKVAVIGFGNPNIPKWDVPANWEGIYFANIVETYKHYEAEMLEQADMIVVVAHSGTDSDPGSDFMKQLVEETDTIAFAFSGHEHKDTITNVTNAAGKVIPILSPYTKARRIAQVKVEVNGDEVTITPELKNMENYPLDPELVELLQPYETDTWENYMLQPIGKALGDYPAANLGTKPSAFMDLINTVQAWGAYDNNGQNTPDKTEDDVPPMLSISAPLTSGNNANLISEGDIMLGDMFGLYRFENWFYQITMNGEEVHQWLEFAATKIRVDDEGNPYVTNGDLTYYDVIMGDGFHYEIDVSKPEGERVVKMTWKGADVAPDQAFTVVVNNYRYNGGGNYVKWLNDHGCEFIANDPDRIIYSTQFDMIQGEDEGQARALLVSYIKKETAEHGGITPFITSTWVVRNGEEEPPVGDLTGKTVILHTNDTHGALMGFAQVAKVKADLEAQGAKVLLVDAGDFSQGNTYVSTSKGATAIEMMNAAGYDIVTLGNHEFDFGYAQLMQNFETAEFMPICADVYNKETGDPILPAYFIKEVNGVKIGFFGMETPETQTKVNPGLISELEFGTNENGKFLSGAQNAISALKAEGADLIIGLVHLGVDAESEPYRSVDLYSKIKDDVDFLIDGHSHTVMTEGPNGEPIQSTGTKASETALMNVGCIVIDNETKKIVENKLIPLGDGAPVDEEVAAVAQEIMDAVNAEFGAVFAQSAVELNGDKAPNGNRDSETNLGDLITDALRWSVMKEMDAETLGVPEENVVAITNGGGIRAWIHAGDVTMNDVHTVLPFGNTVAVVYVTGAELQEALEASTYCTPTAVGGFPQISGMNITINIAKTFDEGELYPGSTYHKPDSIRRVTINDVNGKPFDPEATYAVVTNNFCAAGGDTYYAFSAASSQFDTGIPMDEALMEFIKDPAFLNGYISDYYAEPQGRITIVNPFDDVQDPDKYYYEPVYWAYNHDPEVTSGINATTFGVKNACTRAQIVTFLYAVAGKPAVEATENPFKDVKEGKWYYDAVMWAVQNGITGGMKPDTFGINETCTRAQAVTFLYAMAGKPAVVTAENPFTDVPEGKWFHDAVLWAYENGITGGTTPTTFSPNAKCTRAQIVTFLYASEYKLKKLNFPSTDNADIEKYGNILTDLDAADFFDMGFTWGDIVIVKFLDKSLDLPVVPTYSYVDQGSAAVIVSKDGETGKPVGRVKMAINMGDFATTYGLAFKTTNPDKSYFWTAQEGVEFPVPITVRMGEPEGYMAELILHDINRTNNREDYPNLTDAEFANFRRITTTGMGDHLYRGSSPINPEIGRNTYADAALREAKVTVIMNLANDQAAAEAYEGFADTYYAGQNVIYLNLGVDFQAADFQAGLANGLKFFAANEGVYYVHCTEGKDRAGFVSALLECLMGATYDEVVADYLKTYTNYYTVVDGQQQALSQETLDAIAESNIIKTLKTAFGVSDLKTADLAAEAEEYVAAIGLTADEIAALKTNLSGSDVPLCVETTFPSATKADIDKYGDVHFSITSADLAAAGFEYKDLVKLSFLDQEVIVPVIPEYRYVGAKAPGLVMWRDGAKPAEVEVFNGSFAATYGLADVVRDGSDYTVTPREGVEFPVAVTIEMYEKQGYADTYAIFDLTRSNNREDYRGNTEPYPNLDDEGFANFRKVTTTGMGEGTLYRSSSPINPSIGRNTYADAAAAAAGVKSFVNLADSESSAAKYAGYADTYYAGQNIAFLNLGVDFTTELNRTGLKEAMEFIADEESEAPFLVHCNEGQDRAGFVSALLECLMGATYDEVVADYMLTFYNYYGVAPGSDQYAQISNNIVKNLSTAFGIEMSALATANLAAEAGEYLAELGVSAETIAAVKAKLGGEVAPQGFEVLPDGSNMLKYGHIDLNISVADFLELFELGDIVTVEVNGFTFDAPVVTNYDDVDTGNYLVRCASGKTVTTLAINYGQIGVAAGIIVAGPEGSNPKYQLVEGLEWPMYASIELKEAGGYADELSIRKLTRTNVRSDYDDLTDAEFANFRAVTTTGMGENVLYRSSSPIDPELGRNSYADAAAEAAGIKVFVNLADTEEEAAAFEGYTDSYYNTQTKIFLGLPVAFTSDEFKTGLADGYRFIADNNGPYLIHCLEGKDRTGLSVGVLECLMGASLEEIQADYLKTYENYFEIQNNEHIALTEAQVAYLKGIITKNLGIIFEVEDMTTAALAQEAEAYLTEIGLTADEVAALKAHLNGEYGAEPHGYVPTDTVAAGDQILYVVEYDGKHYAMTNDTSVNNALGLAEVTVDENGYITEASEAAVWTLVSGADGKFQVKDVNGKYISAASGSSTVKLADAGVDFDVVLGAGSSGLDLGTRRIFLRNNNGVMQFRNYAKSNMTSSGYCAVLTIYKYVP